MTTTVRTPPRGLAILALVGPAFIWSAEYIGTGEVLLATRAGAVLGTSILWAVVLGVLLKYWIGLAGARYTVCTGEGMLDMFDRVPGPRHWVVWIVLVVQLVAGALSTGAVATAAGAFLHTLVPPLSSGLAGWLVVALAFFIAWTGTFGLLKGVMSAFVLIIVSGALYAAAHVFPGGAALAQGLAFHVPAVPDWAVAQGVSANPWHEVMPLLGWGAGGFASQVWYSYWVLGADFGVANGRGFGRAADVTMLREMDAGTARRVHGWCRVVHADATIALGIGIVVTGAFVLAGAGVLRPQELVPRGEGAQLASAIAEVFASRWGQVGGTLFLLAALAALVGTLLGQLAGWPRLLADAVRLALPGVHQRTEWKTQFRLWLLLFFCSNMAVVYVMQANPIGIVRTAALLDGILLTALQACWVGVGLYVVLPRLLSPAAWEVLRPHPVFAVGLAVAAVVFGWLTIAEALPQILQLTGITG